MLYFVLFFVICSLLWDSVDFFIWDVYKWMQIINRDFYKRWEKYFSKKKTLKIMAEHGYGQGCVSHF